MARWQKAVLALGVISAGTSGLLSLAGRRTVAAYAILPAVVTSVWIFVGHLVTVDDEAPGGWANPDGVPEVWRQSLLWLAMKAMVCAGVAGGAAWLWMAKK